MAMGEAPSGDVSGATPANSQESSNLLALAGESSSTAGPRAAAGVLIAGGADVALDAATAIVSSRPNSLAASAFPKAPDFPRPLDPLKPEAPPQPGDHWLLNQGSQSHGPRCHGVAATCHGHVDSGGL